MLGLRAVGRDEEAGALAIDGTVAIVGAIDLHGVLPSGATAAFDGKAEAVVGTFTGVVDELVKMFDGVFCNRNHVMTRRYQRGGAGSTRAPPGP